MKAEAKSTRATRRTRVNGDRQPTPAESRSARDKLIRAGAFPSPLNRLVRRDPAKTLLAYAGH